MARNNNVDFRATQATNSKEKYTQIVMVKLRINTCFINNMYISELEEHTYCTWSPIQYN